MARLLPAGSRWRPRISTCRHARTFRATRPHPHLLREGPGSGHSQARKRPGLEAVFRDSVYRSHPLGFLEQEADRTVPRIRAQASLEDPCPRWAPLTCSPPPQVLQLCLPGSQGPTLRLGARSPRPGRLVKAGEAGRGGPHTAWPRPSASPWRLSTAWPSLPSDGQLPVDPLVGVSPVSGDGPSPEESRVGQGQGKPALAFRMPWCHLTQGGLSEPQATLSMALGRPWQGHDSDLQVLQMHLSRQITWIPDSDPPGSHRVHSLTTEH